MDHFEIVREVYCPCCGCDTTYNFCDNGSESKNSYYETYHCGCGAEFCLEFTIFREADEENWPECKKAYEEHYGCTWHPSDPEDDETDEEDERTGWEACTSGASGTFTARAAESFWTDPPEADRTVRTDTTTANAARSSTSS